MASDISPTQLNNGQSGYPTETMFQTIQPIETPEAIAQKAVSQTAPNNTGTSSLEGIATGAVVGGGQMQPSNIASTAGQLPTPNGLSNIPNGNYTTSMLSEADTQEINRLQQEIATAHKITEFTEGMNKHFSKRPKMSILDEKPATTDATTTLTEQDIKKLKSMPSNTASDWSQSW